MIHSTPRDTGWIEVICGSMFSGKTDELIKRIRRARIAKQKTVIFKPRIDVRYSSEHVVSHDQQKAEAIVVSDASEILELAENYHVIGIDEAQFFKNNLAEVCNTLANRGKRVIVAGLDQDYRGVPFEPMPNLLAIAEYITKDLAICMVCGNPANRTQRVSQHTERIVIGDADSYEARCRRCHTVPEQVGEEATQKASVSRLPAASVPKKLPPLLLILLWPVQLFANETDGTPTDRPSIRAVRATSPIRMDGVLDEADWATASVGSGFVQREPFVGGPESEKTEFHVLFDDENLYFGITLHDRNPEEILARSKAPDSSQIWKDDLVSVNLDPQHDHRSMYGFTVTPAGGMLDGKGVNNGEQFITTWDTVWEARTRINPDGWVAEIRIPFASLEYDPAHNSTMGLDVVRNLPRRSELADWAPLVPPFQSFHATQYGHLEGIEVPARGWRKLSLLPYLSTGFRENRTATDTTVPAGERDFVLRPGIDLKYPIRRNAIAQITVKTDFSQVDIDEQQVNLNRFELFFPEKRPFFLEGLHSFEFGIPEFAQLFYSRRIGLADGNEVPLLAGARSYGKIGGTEYGVLNLQTEDTPAVPDRNFSVFRIRQDIFSRSDVGTMIVHQQDTSGPDGGNTAGGIDATYRSEDGRVTVTSFAAGTHSNPNVAGESEGNGGSAYLRTVWTPGLWEVRQSNILVSDGFNPAVGYFERTGIFRGTMTVNRGILLPEKGIKRLTLGTAGNVFTSDEVDSLQDWSSQVSATVETVSGYKYFAGGYLDSDDVLAPFDLKTGVTIPAGRYFRPTLSLSAQTPFQYPITAFLEYDYGRFFGGTIHTWAPTLYAKPAAGLILRTGGQVSWIRLPDLPADYVSTSLNFSGSYSFVPGLALEANSGWNRDADNLELQYRFRWRFAPLSEFFAVYSEERTASNFSTQFRGLIFKVVVHAWL